MGGEFHSLYKSLLDSALHLECCFYLKLQGMCMHFEINNSYAFYYDKLSIRWLVKKHRDMKATKVLARILQTTEKDVEEEIVPQTE